MTSPMSETALHWMKARNLNPAPSRETLIYALGRVGRESLPPELLEILSASSFGWKLNGLPTVEYVN